MKAYRFFGPNGDDIQESEIPADMAAEAKTAREEMLDAASMFSDELMEAMLEDRVTEELIHGALRKATVGLKITPVLIGSAYKNKAVQKLLDAVIAYLPDPTQVVNEAVPAEGDGPPVVVETDPDKPTIALAFKLEDGRYGQLTYLRIYQGKLERDGNVVNMRTGKKHKIGRLVRMHADEMEDITDAGAGDIVAMFGIDCNSGDTFTDGTVNVAMTAMHVPEPVISVAVKATDKASEDRMSKALRRFTKEDPTFRVGLDPESNETVISGMGELHLDVYIERMKREYNATVTTSAPQVAYRETLTKHAEFNYVHKKQTGGSGQYGKVVGFVEPCAEHEFEFVDEIKGGSIPREFIPSVEKGFRSMLAKGRLLGFPVVNVRVVVNDGNSHAVDSSDIAFQEAARGAWRSVFDKAKPKLLEPIMRVVIEGPVEHSGNILTTLMQRRGMIIGSQEDGILAKIESEVPLAEMFGYATTLRSATQGKAEFTMEFARYLEVPANIAEKLIEDAKAKDAKAAKK
jgi:elongation factor G